MRAMKNIQHFVKKSNIQHINNISIYNIFIIQVSISRKIYIKFLVKVTKYKRQFWNQKKKLM